jgi:type VI protein secretion system component VasF
MSYKKGDCTMNTIDGQANSLETNPLERICNSIFVCICNYWQLADLGGAPERETFQHDIIECLENARAEAAKDPLLDREFRWIERPLIFFIDYMVKEGKFLFRDEWRELARNYNELSGDEKFFDLLGETLNYPDTQNAAALFYIMLGLGFDGVYRSDREHVRRCMELCAAKAKGYGQFDLSTQPILGGTGKKRGASKKRSWLTVRVALAASFVFMLICFIINLVVFSESTSSYREVLSRAAADVIPKSIIRSYDPTATIEEGE